MQAGSSAKAVLKCIAPQFVVADVVATSEYYRDVLGFEILGFFADPPVYAMVARDGVEIHFGKAGGPSAGVPDLPSRRLGSDAYIWVDDIFTLFDELTGSGANIIEGPVKRTYESTEVVMRDCNGFTLVFGN